MASPLLLHLAEVDSTQAFLRRHPELGWCGVWADAQTAGRGRQGNAWESAPGAGLWLSASLPPPEVAPGLVLQYAMAAVISVLGQPGLGLKWPNDLVAFQEGRMVKLGGILGERVGGRLLLGLGVNLESAPNLPERSIPPAALKDVAPFTGSARSLAPRILQAWTDLSRQPYEVPKWPEPGMALEWVGGQGVCLGWEPDGRLKVTTGEGIQRLSAAEITRVTSSQGPRSEA